MIPDSEVKVKIGYARVSAKWYQNEFQVAELERQGCDRVWRESLLESDDPDSALRAFMAQVSPGDTVIATRVISVAHSAADLLHFLEMLQRKGAFFRSISEPWIDTKRDGGARVVETIRGMIDFEIEVADLRSRQDADHPQTVGISAGRPPKLTERERFEALSLLKLGKSAAEISRKLGVSRSTISRLKNLLK